MPLHLYFSVVILVCELVNCVLQWYFIATFTQHLRPFFINLSIFVCVCVCARVLLCTIDIHTPNWINNKKTKSKNNLFNLFYYSHWVNNPHNIYTNDDDHNEDKTYVRILWMRSCSGFPLSSLYLYFFIFASPHHWTLPNHSFIIYSSHWTNRQNREKGRDLHNNWYYHVLILTNSWETKITVQLLLNVYAFDW